MVKLILGTGVDTQEVVSITQSLFPESPTSDLELGEKAVQVGALSKGVLGTISNHSSGQDALAFNKEKTVFVVADGLGGSGSYNPQAVSIWSKTVAESIAQNGNISSLATEDGFQSITAKAKQMLEKEGVDLKRPSDSMLIDKNSGIFTTVSAAERTGNRDFNILTLGDSPIYVINKNTGDMVKQYGQDAKTGMTDAPVKNALGVNDKGVERWLGDTSLLENTSITLDKDEILVLATDYFSDFTAQGGNLKDYLSLNADEFGKKVTGNERAKGDDATLLVIDPDGLGSFGVEKNEPVLTVPTTILGEVSGVLADENIGVPELPNLPETSRLPKLPEFRRLPELQRVERLPKLILKGDSKNDNGPKRIEDARDLEDARIIAEQKIRNSKNWSELKKSVKYWWGSTLEFGGENRRWEIQVGNLHSKVHISEVDSILEDIKNNFDVVGSLPPIPGLRESALRIKGDVNSFSQLGGVPKIKE